MSTVNQAKPWDFERLIELLKVLETDPAVEKADFPTDADPDDYPQSLKDVLDYAEAGFGKEHYAEMKLRGYELIFGDCVCIHTSKGTINTGVDHF